MLVTKTLVVCCVCWRAWIRPGPELEDSGCWDSLAELLAREGIGPDDYVVTESYCPQCMAALLQERHVRQTQVAGAFTHV